jgi:hypothetical protein
MKNNKKLNMADSNSEYNYSKDEETASVCDYSKENEEYYNDTLVIIRNELLNYINDKSLPICEYLTINNIDKLISKHV